MREDLFGSVPFNPSKNANNSKNNELLTDPFEMGEFETATVNSTATHQELENAIGLLDKRLLEMKVSWNSFILVC